jgi:hypothetical protein
MKVAAVASNVVLFAAMVLVIVDEGMPPEPLYYGFTLLALAVPALNAAIILATRHGRSPTVWVTGILNAALIGATCWSVVAHFPPSEGPSVWIFALLMLAAPVVTLVLLFGSRAAAAAAAGQPSGA